MKIFTQLILVVALSMLGSFAQAQTTTDAAFPKQIDIFGIQIYATQGVEDNKVLHAASVLAEYLDNNEDGIVDEPRIVTAMIAANSYLVMPVDEQEEEEFVSALPAAGEGQNLFAFETHPEGSSSAGFDATLEEVLHLITHEGYTGAFPEAFAEGPDANSRLTLAMDIARGGHFVEIPSPYPNGAWYTYNDESCDYACMATEYFYWSLTSMLGAQDYESRLGAIEEEWQLNTRALVEATDTAVFALMTDSQFSIPTRIPNGTYDGGTITIGGSLVSGTASPSSCGTSVTYTGSSNQLCIPKVYIEGGTTAYSITLNLASGSQFIISEATELTNSNTEFSCTADAVFSATSGQLCLPLVNIAGSSITYNIVLQLGSDNAFTIASATTL